MAKKKKSIDLTSQEILFHIETTLCKVIRFYPHNMTVDIIHKYKTKEKQQQNIPFAYLPKNIKRLIKPN